MSERTRSWLAGYLLIYWMFAIYWPIASWEDPDRLRAAREYTRLLAKLTLGDCWGVLLYVNAVILFFAPLYVLDKR